MAGLDVRHRLPEMTIFSFAYRYERYAAFSAPRPRIRLAPVARRLEDKLTTRRATGPEVMLTRGSGSREALQCVRRVPISARLDRS